MDSVGSVMSGASGITEDGLDALVETLETSVKSTRRCLTPFVTRLEALNPERFNAVLVALAQRGHDRWCKRIAHEYIERCSTYRGNHDVVRVILRHVDLDGCMASVRRRGKRLPHPPAFRIPIDWSAIRHFSAQCLMAGDLSVAKLVMADARSEGERVDLAHALLTGLATLEAPEGGRASLWNRAVAAGLPVPTIVAAIATYSSDVSFVHTTLVEIDALYPGGVTQGLRQLVGSEPDWSTFSRLLETFEARDRARTFAAPSFTVMAP